MFNQLRYVKALNPITKSYFYLMTLSKADEGVVIGNSVIIFCLILTILRKQNELLVSSLQLTHKMMMLHQALCGKPKICFSRE